MQRSMTKAERLREMERLYFQHAYSDIEMAERLGVDRTTVYRDRQELELAMPFVKDEAGGWRIDRTRYLSSVRVNLPEALSLYLAARRTSQQTRFAQAHVASALEKLALALRQPLTTRLVQAAHRILAQRQDPQRTAVFETVATAWIEGRRLRLSYRALRDDAERVHRFAPYLLEPSPWNDGIYLIGQSDLTSQVLTLKLDRIVAATLLGPFEPPEDFDEEAMLRHAWGIWGSEEVPQVVKLRFAPGLAARRLRESIWHPLEEVTELDDGGCVWQAPIAEWQEMVPWVRGWGASVEVLEPAALRAQIAGDAQALAATYDVVGRAMGKSERLLRCWGKTGKRDGEFHPALYHMLDVGHVARELLGPAVSPRWRNVLADALNADPHDLILWLPWIIALHDIGKVSALFQAQHEGQKQRLQQEGFPFPQPVAGFMPKIHHSLLGRMLLRQEFGLDLPPNLKTAVLEMISGHHGVFQQDGRQQRNEVKVLNEDQSWAALRQHAAGVLSTHLRLGEVDWPEPANVSSAVMALTGFSILCDWLGSDSTYFQCMAHMPLEEYILHSRHQAHAVVANAGFTAPVRSAAPAEFTALFPEFAPPRPLQLAIDQIPHGQLRRPVLAIIEAPTGEGKTEAAFALAHRIGQARGSDEFYMALPTTATSNQMFVRTQAHLAARLGLAARVRLVHGQAFLVEDDLRIEPLDNGAEDASIDLTWFIPKKRALLAPFGVGTIDQAELSALNVRHNALRLIGLAGKVVILDEVHAYDVYMTTIIERMLAWLAALGTSVILLSATLPAERRRALLNAFGAAPPSEATDAYPLILIGNEQATQVLTPPAHQPDRGIGLASLTLPVEDERSKAAWLVEQVREGGCACWITNTVQEAQAIFAQVADLVRDGGMDIDLTLAHARFPIEERQAHDEAVMARYGREGQRPVRGIVVGTQVLEQSLDLDFDVMATDLAPVDLVLQRAGRLHRHTRPSRPDRHREPVLWIYAPLDAEGRLLPRHQRIYTPYLLSRTWQALSRRQALSLPSDYRILLEEVYAEVAPDPADSLYLQWQQMVEQQQKHIDEARLRIVREPDAEEAFCVGSDIQFHEDEESTAWMVAQTRLGQESITVIPLERVDDTTARLFPLDACVALKQRADRATQYRLMRRSLRLNHPAIVAALKQQDDVPALFRESALLRNTFPLWLEQGRAELIIGKQVYCLVLDARLGLIIERQESA